MKSFLAIALLMLAVSARAAGPISGHLDLSTLPTIGAWQSLTSVDQAVGISKRVFHLDWDGQTLINVSAFGGVTKPMLTEPATPLRFLAGDVIAIPGSVLDWALGTKWGDAWLPKLKTGVLFAHDVSRFGNLKLKPDFIGIGAMMPFGSPN